MLDFFFPDLRRRADEKELMDMEGTDTSLLLATVRQFEIFNKLLSASRHLIRSRFFPVMERDPKRHYSLLDMGTGGCDIPVWFAREARVRGFRVSITAIDHDSRIIPLAMDAASDYPEIKVVCANALDFAGPGEFDFIFSNHFLHHLSWDEIEVVLSNVIKRVRLGFLMNDLDRSGWAYAGYTVLAGLLVRKSLAFFDGRLSIRRGFKERELSDFINKRFPSSRIGIRRTNPARIYIYWPV